MPEGIWPDEGNGRMPHVVGLDIGASAVRAAELDLGSGPPALVAFGQVGLPPGAIVDGEVKDQPAVTDAIVRLWKNGQFTARSVVIGLAGLRAITREIDLPFVPDDEVDSAVRFQSEEVIPFPPEKTLLSAQVLADYPGPDGTTMRRVLVAAAHRDIVDGVVRAAEQAGLQVQGVDLVSSALVRALADRGQSDRPEAIVSIGAGLSVVVIHQQGRPQFVRTIGTAGNAATAAISSALDLPLADAEGIKRRLGEDIPQVQAAERAVQPCITELVGELRNSIQYFASLPGRAPISRVLVTGGGSRLHGLVGQLQSEVRIPVEVVSPLARLDLSKLDLRPDQSAAIDPVLAAPIGLALPEPDGPVRNFNLVPPEVRQRAFVRTVTRWAMAGAGVVVLVLAGFSALRFLQVHNDQNAVDNATVTITRINAQIPQYDAVVAAADVLRTTKAEVSAITRSAPDWYAVLTQLGKDTPCLPAPDSGCLQVTAFSGSATTAAPASSAGTAVATPAANTTAGIGTLALSVSGTFVGDPHYDPLVAWLQAVGPPMFVAPPPPPVTNAPAGGGTTVSFSSPVTITAQGNLANNASY